MVHLIASPVAVALSQALKGDSACDMDLISADGDSISVHSFVLLARYSALLDRAKDPARPSKKARSPEGEAQRVGTIELPECSTTMLGHLLHFIYSDAIPEKLSVDDAFSLMAVVSQLHGSPGRPPLPIEERLRDLCVVLIASQIRLDSVVHILFRSLFPQCVVLEHKCFAFLASTNPTRNEAFSRQLIDTLHAYPEALSRAITIAATGTYNPSTPIEPIQIKSPGFTQDFTTLWRHTCVLGEVSDESGGKSDMVIEACGASVAAHSFLLCARSEYFKAALSSSESHSFLESAVSCVNIKFPEPSPSLQSLQTFLRFLYVGSIDDPDWPIDGEVALDLLHITQSDGAGYFGLKDNSSLRAQALKALKLGLSSENFFRLLRRSTAMNQIHARDVILDRIADRDEFPLFDDRLEIENAIKHQEFSDWWTLNDELDLFKLVLCAHYTQSK